MAGSRVIDLSTLQQFTAVQLLSDGGDIPGFKRVPQCAQVRLVWQLGDAKLAFNVLHGRYSGGFVGSPAQANSIATALSTGAAWTALAGFLAPTASFIGIQLRNVDVADQPLITSTNIAVPGTSAGTEIPNEVALVITKRTAKVGKANRGRIYVPGWATNALGTTNQAAAGAVTALQNWANTITSALSGQGYTFVIGQPARKAYTGITGTAHPARDATSEPVTSVIVRDNHWDSQRKRGLK